MWHQADIPVSWDVPAYCLVAFLLVNFMVACVGHATSDVHHLSLDATLSLYAMTSCMMSQHCVCMGHMTFGYKSLRRGSFRALLLWVLGLPGSPLAPAYGWCLMRVGRDVSSTSPGWSLLP